jgi:hypothetical protein
MKRHYNIYLFLLLLAFTACVSQPVDTYNKKIAAFEISYNEALKTALVYLNDPTISEDKKIKIKEAVSNVSNLRSTMQIAESIGDISKAENQLQLAQKSLLILRQLAQEGKL